MESQLIRKAKSIIELAGKEKLELTQRIDLAIELASLMLTEAQATQTKAEKRIQAQLSRMMNDPVGKAFTTSMTDQCFRTNNPKRIANQLVYLMKQHGIPNYLSLTKKVQLMAFKHLSTFVSESLVLLTKHMLRKETSAVILPGEEDALIRHMEKRRKEGVRINLNHLGEAILGEEEARNRLNTYLDDLKNPEIEYVSIKISTIFSQINLLAWDYTLSRLSERLKELYRMAKAHHYTRPDGSKTPKFVNLDMEEYRDLDLTVAVFMLVLEDPEFKDYPAGIVLQSYVPDSFDIQKKLTTWAMNRVKLGGAPIKIRIVKGANLAMERVESSLKCWAQAPYDVKSDVDANYKRMVTFGCQPEHAKAVHIGIASHNLFDIAYGLLLRAENHVEKEVTFEMLEGMADHMRRIVQKLAGGMLLYCPAATREEFQNAVAYLVRRLDENTAPENFLRHAFEMHPGSHSWKHQAELFSKAAQTTEKVRHLPRKQQNRHEAPEPLSLDSPFTNEADTDWSLIKNRLWGFNIVNHWWERDLVPIPLVIDGKEIFNEKSSAEGIDPSFPEKPLYQYALATKENIDQALDTAKQAQKEWGNLDSKKRSQILANVAQEMRVHRGNLIGAMICDTGKTVYEGDVEVSEAIDFIEYYWRDRNELAQYKDVEFKPKGTILVAPPWNFPCSIATGGISAALAAGNCVIFKPATESILSGWEVANIFWRAGVSKKVLQFITCEDDPIGSMLVKDPRIDGIVLTGATETGKLFLKMKPGLDLMAETGGKNTLIVTSLSDRDLAVKDIIASAFGHAGQKCSACSLLICEAEVYDDENFRSQLKDATLSLKVGSPWNLASKVNPLVRAPNPTLLKGLTELEEGEEWLVKPVQNDKNPNLWSPGIKLGVKPTSFSYKNELFGPVLSVMRADDLKHALKLANGTSYGLTAGIHSLDEREKKYWIDHIEAGNCYINRTITGAIVERQPFGGCKDSSIGPGIKAGGPNYVMQLMTAKQKSLPQEKAEFDIESKLYKRLHKIAKYLHKHGSDIERQLWESSLGSYAYYWKNYFSKKHDPSLIIGQDNFLSYVPHKKIILRVNQNDSMVDILRVIAAAEICGSILEVSLPIENKDLINNDLKSIPKVDFVEELEEQFVHRIKKDKPKYIRFFV